ncbi:hypothetical protein D3C72_2252950 [compost metagenome]
MAQKTAVWLPIGTVQCQRLLYVGLGHPDLAQTEQGGPENAMRLRELFRILCVLRETEQPLRQGVCRTELRTQQIKRP